MSDNERLPKQRVNFYDGQKITENDLDVEQIYHRTVTSEIVKDFHGSGVLKLNPFSSNILLDTRFPSENSPAGEENPSKLDIENGRYDGLGLSLDKQPSDIVRGSRIVVELVDVDIKGRNGPKVLIIGRTFDGLNSSGILNYEFIDFETNIAKVSKYYYQKVIAVFFNNFSGGTGRTENEASKDSLDLISENNGYAIISEAEPLTVFAKPIMQSQTASPSLDMANFITSSVSRTIEDEIALALDSTSSITELYFETTSKEQLRFEKDGSTTVSYGQKFLSKSNNLQRIDLVLSVERDDDQPEGEEFDWTGDLVLGIHEISGTVRCPTDAVPDDLIEFDPELNPLLEVSFGQDDFETFGYKLTDKPQVVSFNFAGTLIADPNIDPSIQKDKYYAFILSRRGDNRTGTIIMEQGYDNPRRKRDLGISLSIEEQFAKQETRFVEFDPARERYIDDPNSSLWFKIFSDTIEVMCGTAYADSGKSSSIPKTQNFVGGNEISYFEDNIPLAAIANSSNNFIIFNQIDRFLDADTHPLTGDRVFVRIEDAASISVVDDAGLADLLEDTVPLILSKVNDQNVRDASDLNGVFSRPGEIGPDRITIIEPSAALLNSNLIGRVIVPDTDCICTARYRIVDVVCREVLAGDLDQDGELSFDDINLLLDIVGNTINSSVTEKAIMSGDLDLVNFVQSDLNADDSVDGFDIDILEDALDGYVNFTVPERIKILELILENVLEEDDFPVIFTDTASSGVTNNGLNTISFVTSTSNEALAMRPGDTITIPTGLDAGDYILASKTILADGITINAEVTNLAGNIITFQGANLFNVTVTSGTRVNTFADNLSLLDIPFTSKNYTISFVDFPFRERFIEICDLRRYVETSFAEEVAADPCACDESDCSDQEDCAPVYKTQSYMPGDLYLPNGNILTAPGVPHPGDYEYVNVLMPLPPGSITGCAVNLYETFVKVDQDCRTAAGFPAMQYSDGTYVGCNDSGAVTDLALGRVKFSHAIASLYVDAFVDGYGSDGEADASLNVTNEEAISENFIDFTYNTFSTWTDDAFNDGAFGTVTKLAGPNQPAVFDVTTIGTAGEKYIRIDTPLAAQDFADDFIVDFTAARIAWPQSALSSGVLKSHATFEVTNLDGSSATLELGWRATPGTTAKIYYSGVIRDSGSTIISSFDFETDAPENIGQELLFRLRRINDAFFAYYIVPGKIGDSTSNFGEYVRLGSNPSIQPGGGTVSMSYQVVQNNAPNSGQNFMVNLSEVVIRSEYTSSDIITTATLGRNAGTGVIDRLTCNFPINLNSRTNIISATLSFTVDTGGNILDAYNIIPLDILNSSNLGRIYNVPITQNGSLITQFIPGVILAGETVDIDITPVVISFVNNAGHLPGFVQGFIIEPEASADSSFVISSDLELTITYEDITTGVVFQVGVSLNPITGVATFNTKNVLYDATIEENRTVINVGVHLKKAGFKNRDLQTTIVDLDRIGIGDCKDEEDIIDEENCFFVVGSTAVGTFVEGPFPCSAFLP